MNVPRGNAGKRVKGWLLLWVGAQLMTGCIVAPPIEVRPLEENKPPFLDEFQPTNRSVVVTTPNLVLRARLYDQNRERSLSVAWFGKKSGFIMAGEYPILPKKELEKGIFYEFEPAVFELATCSNTLRLEEQETIWLYVSDRRLQFPTVDTVTTEEGGFMASTSWDLHLSPDRCNTVSK